MNNSSSVEPNQEPAAMSRTSDLPSSCLPVQRHEDVLPAYRGTPVEELLAYHNLGAPIKQHPAPELLIGTCMDFRILFRIPRDFAYVLRVGGANLRGLEFHVSLAVAAGVRAICLIGHDQCAMRRVADRGAEFVSGLVEHAGWGDHEAAIHFETYSSRFAIGDEIEFVRSESARLSRYYPRMLVAPLFYCVRERTLHQIT